MICSPSVFSERSAASMKFEPMVHVSVTNAEPFGKLVLMFQKVTCGLTFRVDELSTIT